MAFSNFLINLGEVAGLEINEKLLRAVLLVRSGNELKINSAGQISLPSGVIVSGQIKNPKILAGKISELFRLCRPHKIKSSHVIVSLPEEISYSQVLSFPSLPPEKQEEAIELNLERISPYKKESVYSHFQEIKSSGEGRNEVLTLSARSDDIEAYLSIFKSLNLIPLAFEVPSVSLARSAGLAGPACFAFIYPTEAVLSVVERGSVRFSYLAKIKNSDDLSAAIQSVINYFEAHNQESDEIKNVFLAGYNVKDFKEKISASSDEKIEFLPSKIQTKDYQILPGSESLVALGAALRGLFALGEDNEVSLLPLGAKDQAFKLREKEFFGFLHRMIILSLIGIVAIFTGFWFLLYNMMQRDGATLANLEKAPKTEEVANLEDEAKSFNLLVDGIYKYKDKKIYYSPILNLLSRSTVSGVTLRAMDLSEDGKINLAGVASRRDDVLAFSDNLKKIKEFKEVDLPVSSLKEKENVNFALSFKVDPQLMKEK